MRITGKHLPHISVPHFPKEKLKIFHGRNYRNLSTVILRKGTIERQKDLSAFKIRFRLRRRRRTYF